MVDTAGSNSLSEGTSESPLGKIKIGALEAKVDNLGLQLQPSEVSLQVAATSQADGFSGLVYAREGLPEVQFSLGAARAMLSQASLDARRGTARWQAAGGAAIDSLIADFAQGEEGAVKFGRAEIKTLQANERLQFAADELTVNGLDLYVKRSLIKALRRDGNIPVAKAPSEDALASSAVPLTPETGKQTVDVKRIQTLLTELGYVPGPVDGRMGRRTAAAIREFQRRQGLKVDGRLTADLLAALEARAARPAVGNVKTAVPSLRLGYLALIGDPVIRFRDDTVKPQVTINTVFKEAQVRNLDTQKKDQRTDLRVVADVNEFTHLELGGWVTGFGTGANLDLKAKVENLVLSTYSPYVAELAGVYLESGQLDTTAEGKATRGSLLGEIQLELENIAFRPLSAADAERVTSTTGVPLEAAVSVLQDADGRIVLKLPLSGTLSKPDVDISTVVTKAIGGTLKKVFPPTMAASLLSKISKGTGLVFDPIEFAPGSAELDQAGRRFADALAEFLAEHPKLLLNVCGRSTARDMGQLSVGASAATPPIATSERVKSENAKAEPAPEQMPKMAQALEELAIECQRAVRRYLIKDKGGETDFGVQRHVRSGRSR